MRMGLSTIVVMLCSAVAITACGEFSFKRGGSIGDLQAAQNKCRVQTSGDAAYRHCMSDAGWTTETFAYTTITTTASPAGPAGSVPNTSASSFPSAPPASATPAPDAPRVISSWWKNGGSGDDLSASLSACRTTTGDTATNGAVSGAMVACMRQKGWIGATSAGIVH